MATPSKDQTAAKKTEAKTAVSKPYVEQAGDIAADVRALADRIREDVTALTDRIDEFHQNTEPETSEVPVADGVRRLNPTFATVIDAANALDLAGADLYRTSTI